LTLFGRERVVPGAPLPGPPPPPKNGTAPRIDVTRAAGRLGQTRHTLAAWCGGDGYPVVIPVTLEHGSWGC
jgi:hypothetical protein